MYNIINHHVLEPENHVLGGCLSLAESVSQSQMPSIKTLPLSKNAKQRPDHNTYHIWLNFTSHTHTQRHYTNTLLPKQSIWDN